MKQLVMTLVVAVALLHGVGAQQSSEDLTRREGTATRLTATRHAPLPADLSQYWFVQDVPGASAGARRPDPQVFAKFARGVRAIAGGDFAVGLPLVNGTELTGTPLADYARYYTGVALAGLSKFADADAVFSALYLRTREGDLKEAVPLRLAEVALARQDAERAKDVLRGLKLGELSNPEEALLKLGHVEEILNHRDHALEAYRRVYYTSALTTQAIEAQAGIERLQTTAIIPGDLVARALERAERLFAARRWAQARAGFEPLAKAAEGADKDLIALRLAECDYYLDRFRAARVGLKPLLKGWSREAEVRFFNLAAARGLGEKETFVTLARELVAEFPDSEWAAETLNGLASFYLVADEDAEADRVFRELALRFPKHRYAERAAWKAGWASYRNRQFAEALAMFESAAAAFPRADNRPAWLYWAGRSRDQLNDPLTANARYRLVVADYHNSYYGRLAAKILTERREPVMPDPADTVIANIAPVKRPPTEALMRDLTSLQLYDDALKEVQYAQRVWGETPQLQATAAWIRYKQGLGLRAQDRFVAIRGAITMMRRAYPQFLAAGGEDLPADVLRIIFPLDYWPLIEKYSELHGLDPYLIAALMAQESTFTAEIRSSANARGLMQLMPATGRIYARKLGMRGFTTASLLQPETNVRLGAQYFKDLVDRFGGAHYALASYNAGENRVARWMTEAPGLPADEFIDNIPFPETQNYVKRILGTAEDYRRLYGTGLLSKNPRLAAVR
ncbi:MAG TPA: transglycosylase SLT domain-containing protein [Vicinamibacterales bacterium]|nr:transglycosylase SLT domain-containing protein [Vicinamibacterales bacterium]